MSVNLAAVEALFPPTMPNQSAAGVAQAPTIRGPCPYDAFERGRFSPLFVGVIETVRSDTKWGAVYRGDLTTYGGDHSSADLALCGEFKRLGLDALAIDTAFRTSGLYRAKWERDDYRTRTIAIATGRPDGATARSSGGLLAPENGRVSVSTIAPPPRDWLIDSMMLAGKSAVLAGLGGVSKSQWALQLGIAVATGRDFAGRASKKGGVLVLSGEEDREELDRRINAVHRHAGFPQADLDLIRENLLAHPLVGTDIRFTLSKSGVLEESPFVAQIIQAAQALQEVRLIILDHAGLIHGGDFSAKQDAALTMRLVNRVALETGAAVVMLAHSPKSSTKEEPDASGVFGSTAFVEQSRGSWLLTTMSKDQAKRFNISETERLSYVALTGVKANYTAVGQEFWFRRVTFDEIGLLQHVNLIPASPLAKRPSDLRTNILSKVSESPGRYSKTGMRDQFQGKKHGAWKASKAEIEHEIEGMLERGELISRAPTPDERKLYAHRSQVGSVLVVAASNAGDPR